MTEIDEDLRKEVQQLRKELEQLKKERKDTYTQDRSKDTASTEEPAENAEEPVDAGFFNRRTFLKTLAGSAAGLGMAGLASGFQIHSDNGFQFFGNGNPALDVDTQGAITADSIDLGQGAVSNLAGDNLRIDSGTLNAASSMASVSDSGTQLLDAPTDLNFGADLDVTDDGDGTVTIDAAGGSAGALSGLSIDTDKDWQGYSLTNLGHSEIGDFINHTMEGALELLGSADGQGIILQNRDDSVALNEGRANITWITHGDATGSPEKMCSITSHPTDSAEFSVYTKGSPIGDGNQNLEKRLNIGGGAQTTKFRVDNNSVSVFKNEYDKVDVRLAGDEGSWLSLRQLSSGKDAGIEFRDGGSNLWRLYRDASQSTFRLFNHDIGAVAFEINRSDNTWDFTQNVTQNVVWDSGSSRPSNPQTGQRFFDTSLGQPIWYDGSNWVDANGNTV